MIDLSAKSSTVNYHPTASPWLGPRNLSEVLTLKLCPCSKLSRLYRRLSRIVKKSVLQAYASAGVNGADALSEGIQNYRDCTRSISGRHYWFAMVNRACLPSLWWTTWTLRADTEDEYKHLSAFEEAPACLKARRAWRLSVAGHYAR